LFHFYNLSAKKAFVVPTMGILERPRSKKNVLTGNSCQAGRLYPNKKAFLIERFFGLYLKNTAFVLLLK